MQNSHLSAARVFRIALLSQAALLLLALGGLWLTEVERPAARGSEVSWILTGALAALATYALAVFLTRLPGSLGSALRRLCALLHPLFAGCSWGQIAVLATAAGICEELFFRVFLQNWLAGLVSPWWGLFAASVVFALLHFASVLYFTVTLVMGLLLGWFYWSTGSALGVMVWHGLYDLLAIGMLARYPHLLGIKPQNTLRAG
ncbi:CPBP family intramembrane metalloprotease [Microbulbifer flavimaris]|uniref:CPBP family intramembrane metalloprotease n=1 Tax=Microbulbifer flavimaris TaxID=1781068 RepID=A0ABX4HW46_9GAMM|nr:MULTISPECIES: CPBP family intramembrane glutamic endopeptidase [Microbulbifer]KUJ80261.1 hypothetical protein AVO43_14700 [Microbulbifer sp. ZGT114]PCO04325.1 CPBP family intramembrane metalloprotease [Microbulbifer flavimaris]